MCRLKINNKKENYYYEKKKVFAVLGMCMVFTMGLIGCGGSQEDNIGQNVSEVANDTSERIEATDKTEEENQTASYPLSD